MTARAFILISTDLGAERDVFEELKTIPNVVDLSLVYGVYDIVATVEAESMEKNSRTRLLTRFEGWTRFDRHPA